VHLLHARAVAPGELQRLESLRIAAEEERMAAAGVVVVRKDEVPGELPRRPEEASLPEAEAPPERLVLRRIRLRVLRDRLEDEPPGAKLVAQEAGDGVLGAEVDGAAGVLDEVALLVVSAAAEGRRLARRLPAAEEIEESAPRPLVSRCRCRGDRMKQHHLGSGNASLRDTGDFDGNGDLQRAVSNRTSSSSQELVKRRVSNSF
jgi:hypothetical protein